VNLREKLILNLKKKFTWQWDHTASTAAENLVNIAKHASKAGTRYNKRWIEPYLYNSFSFRRHPPSLIASLDAPNKVKDYLLYELKGP
jgi:hypothetical protein